MDEEIDFTEAMDLLSKISKDLANVEHLQNFINNMLDHNNRYLTPFEWWTYYLAWSEVSTREDMENYYG